MENLPKKKREIKPNKQIKDASSFKELIEILKYKKGIKDSNTVYDIENLIQMIVFVSTLHNSSPDHKDIKIVVNRIPTTEGLRLKVEELLK